MLLALSQTQADRAAAIDMPIHQRTGTIGPDLDPSGTKRFGDFWARPKIPPLSLPLLPSLDIQDAGT